MGRRWKVGGAAVYHCISRTVAGAPLLDVEAKEVFRKMLWEAAEFSGVEIVTYCIMSNHFHVLVRVPEKSAPDELKRDELVRRYAVIYRDRTIPGFPSPENMGEILLEEKDEAKRWEKRLRARMEDVSEFMKLLKQRFALWYNHRHKRFGVFWAERFKSVLVENRPQVLQTVAAYIDLNPIRARMAEDPSEYRWCGYAEAMGGHRRAQQGISLTVDAPSLSERLQAYRVALFGKGSVTRDEGDGALLPERVQKVLRSGGRVASTELLRCRVRYFTDGAVIGSRGFVEEVGNRLFGERDHEHKKVRSSKRLGQFSVGDALTVYSWRNLQRAPIS
jgi:REP element-mobilizing transposase RayT